jgi:drug/metabolite transporter (DMT)-like permease
VPASRAAVFNYGEPVVAVALGAVLLGERLSAQAVAGALIIALSVFLLQRGKGAESPAPDPDAQPAGVEA